MTFYVDVTKTWTILYSEVVAWMGRWSPKDRVQDLAAQTWVNVLRNAMNGMPSARGLYRDVYAGAECVLREASVQYGTCVPNGIWHTISVPVPEFLDCLAVAYTGIYEMAELGALTVSEQHLLLGVLGRCRLDDTGSLITPLGDPDVPAAMTILDRCARAVNTHQCRQRDNCDEFAIMFRTERAKHHRWLAAYKPHYKEFTRG